MTATINVGADPENLAYDSTKGEIFVTEGYIVQVISDKTNTVVANITMGTGPVGIAYDSGKGELFVAVFGSNVVAVISDSSTGATSSTSSSSPVSTSSTASSPPPSSTTSSRSSSSSSSSSSSTSVSPAYLGIVGVNAAIILIAGGLLLAKRNKHQTCSLLRQVPSN